MIHIHINENLTNLLNHFPAFSFFKSHNFFSQVGPDNKITHARCSKPLNIIQNKILVFILTTSNTVWSVLNQMCTLLHLFLPENHSFFKKSRKNSKNLQKAKPFKIYRRKWFQFATIYLDCLYDTRVGLWRGGQRYRNTLYSVEALMRQSTDFRFK